MKIPPLDQATLKSILHYEPRTGVWTWRERPDVRPQWNGRFAGKRAGYARQATGGGMYWSIRIFDWPFHSSRLAWLYMTGQWPAELVDHKNLDGLDDRWENLREATKSQNAANTEISKRNTTGFKGVSFCKKAKRYRATIRDGSRQRWLGYYDTAEAAHAAYCAAAIEIFGSFARAA